ncbi:MAG: glycosyltransferase family 2 protein [Caldilineales bacterium]|nr:glycosyltransferase family 2 protein [Caldilineales bacterium]
MIPKLGKFGFAISVLVTSLGLFYHYVMLIAGTIRLSRKTVSLVECSLNYRFAIAIPAHNEEQVISSTVTSLKSMQYPSSLYDIHVVADHCKDATAEIAASSGAIIHVRNHGQRGRKGYALTWLISLLLEYPVQYDAIVVFDADSSIDPDYLKVVTQKLADGAMVVQGQHVILNPDDSLFTAFADLDMRLNNLIRNQAKENLGLSARLMGDGMCFHREILLRHPWVGDNSLTEDREYGISLTCKGIRIHYAAEAMSYGQAAGVRYDASNQRQRWYGGAYQLQRRYFVSLLKTFWHKRDLSALDRWLELYMPPFSVLTLLATSMVGIVGVLRVLKKVDKVFFAYNLTLFILTGLFPLFVLLIERVPLRRYLVLVFGPFYALWRLRISLLVRIKGEQIDWVRTRRREELPLNRI